MMAGLGALTALMGGGLPAFPCPVCTVELEQAPEVGAGSENVPATVTTMILGTPVCDEHAARLVAGLEALPELLADTATLQRQRAADG